MVDFRKRLSQSASKVTLVPSEIYETFDRASDKGELRTAQKAILKEWYDTHRNRRDVIIKLHTGQGKTLIGLLILQSKLLETREPVLYLCPNNHLIKQTCAQAEQFGVAYTTAEGDLPEEFLDGKRILITSVQKLFNGLTKFHLGARSIPVAALLMDDSHACVDAIRDACMIKLDHTEQAYQDIIDLFTPELERQGSGTLSDIKRRDGDSLLCVPYWDWMDKHLDVVRILSEHLNRHSGPKDKDSAKFAWPIIRDIIRDCQCVISGTGLEIVPYLPPLDLFGTYDKAQHRVFMSATVTDDSFLIKGLRLAPETVQHPLIYKDEKWSGEKMILIPSLIDEELDKLKILTAFAKPSNRASGLVVLASSGQTAKQWQVAGSTIATKENIYDLLDALRRGNYTNTIVLVNRYDGVDLPDNMCRILVLDNKPYFESLVDLYMESCIPNSEEVAIKTARKIEQGLGRSVRGEKDYCAIVLVGAELVRFVRSRTTLRHFSLQTKRQIELGLEIADMAQQEIKGGKDFLDAFYGLIDQCLRRDPTWKDFYVQEMNALSYTQHSHAVAPTIALELAAELKYQEQAFDRAMSLMQQLSDEHGKSDAEKGWYLQHMARYCYRRSKTESNALQLAAHSKNRFVLKPKDGMKVTKIQMVSQKRMENIISFVKGCGTPEELSVTIDQVLGDLAFGVQADKFEQAFDNLGRALGFECERPDKCWKEGPDNLWAVQDGEYLVVECKNCVDLQRAEINKDESGQMNNACAWFERNYPGAKSHPIIIIPPNTLGNAAGFNTDVQVMRQKHLSRLVKSVRSFFQEFRNQDFASLSEGKVQQFVDTHKLSVMSLISEYSEKVRTY